MFLDFRPAPNDLMNVVIAVQEPLVELVAHQYPSIGRQFRFNTKQKELSNRQQTQNAFDEPSTHFEAEN